LFLGQKKCKGNLVLRKFISAGKKGGGLVKVFLLKFYNIADSFALFLFFVSSSPFMGDILVSVVVQKKCLSLQRKTFLSLTHTLCMLVHAKDSYTVIFGYFCCKAVVAWQDSAGKAVRILYTSFA